MIAAPPNFSEHQEIERHPMLPRQAPHHGKYGGRVGVTMITIGSCPDTDAQYAGPSGSRPAHQDQCPHEEGQGEDGCRQEEGEWDGADGCRIVVAVAQ